MNPSTQTVVLEYYSPPEELSREMADSKIYMDMKRAKAIMKTKLKGLHKQISRASRIRMC